MNWRLSAFSLCSLTILSVGLLGCPAPQVTVTVPNVVNMTQVAAVGAIGVVGLSVGTIYEDFSDTVPVGQVIEQFPLPGAIVVQGTAVDLLISLGPEEEEQTTETVMLPGNVPLELVWIPAGTFLMGRYPGEQFSYSDEDPRHSVTVPGFWMAKYELTKRQWKAVMGTEPWSGQTYGLNDLDSPAEYVSWEDAKAFIAALNTLTGKTFRLPSEAEWEYAARAGTTTRFYWGDDPTLTVGDAYNWWASNTWDVGQQYAHVVGQKLPNAFGLYDMSGNVYEWCEDDWHDNYVGAPTNGSAWVGSPRGAYRVSRGGGWYYAGYQSRSAYRNYFNPLVTDFSLGFRVCR